ncbi:MAG: hypothetical protein CL675_01080 [Bdellovibrionaceae bacterium]|nr:hypothetical protein [Pseudobdellovibrionaceae bacterium]|tara:strand:+ start:56 stop:592 length:537 start_codon:yes stop_codon:yes gene_type:complete
MKSLLLGLIVLASASFASADTPVVAESTDVSFTLRHIRDDGARVYYAADVVERAAERILEALGATDINVRVRGGVGVGEVSPFSRIRARFSRPVATTGATELLGSFQEFDFAGRNSRSGSFGNGMDCHLFKELFRVIKTKFAIQYLQESYRCYSSFGRFDVRGEVLAFADAGNFVSLQ